MSSETIAARVTYGTCKVCGRVCKLTEFDVIEQHRNLNQDAHGLRFFKGLCFGSGFIEQQTVEIVAKSADSLAKHYSGLGKSPTGGRDEEWYRGIAAYIRARN